MFDVLLGRHALPRCDGVSRRDVLRIGALAGLGLTLPGLFRWQALLAGSSWRLKPRAKSVILV
jgi:hypothetical protein